MPHKSTKIPYFLPLAPLGSLSASLAPLGRLLNLDGPGTVSGLDAHRRICDVWVSHSQDLAGPVQAGSNLGIAWVAPRAEAAAPSHPEEEKGVRKAPTATGALEPQHSHAETADRGVAQRRTTLALARHDASASLTHRGKPGGA